jgi:lysophospholipase L1-like esterase
VYTIKIVVNGPDSLVYLNGEPLFGVSDSSLSSGSVGLYTQGNVRFDNVVIKGSSFTPKVVIFQSTSYFVETSPTLVASTVAMNIPSGGGVKFVLDNGVSFFTDFAEPYFGQFTNVSQGTHTVTASIVNSSGIPVSGSLTQDTNVRIGVRGNYFVGFGDSITSGVGDDFPSDNNSFDGRNLARGYTPILNDLLSSSLNKPITIMNEGLGGTKSGSGAASGTGRINSTKNRHTESQYWLILFGTNDSSGTMPVPSGINCTEADFQGGTPSCISTYKANMRQLILNLKNAGKVPLLAKVPFALNVPSSTDQLIRDYNVVVNQLVAEHNIPVTPPDFYSYFKNHQGEFADDLHPNGNGYISIANLWFNALIQSGILSQ